MSNIDQYAKSRQLELARRIRDAKKVYLDTRFWIIVRDVSLGIDVRPTAVELTDMLRTGVANERLICPISESTFTEVLKQAQGRPWSITMPAFQLVKSMESCYCLNVASRRFER